MARELQNVYELDHDSGQWKPTGEKVDMKTGRVYSRDGEFLYVDEEVAEQAEETDWSEDEIKARDDYLGELAASQKVEEYEQANDENNQATLEGGRPEIPEPAAINRGSGKFDDVTEIEDPPEDTTPDDWLQLAEDFGHIETWDDVLQEGINLRQEVDDHRWKLADYLRYVVPETSPGRPIDGMEDKTLSSIANAIGEDRSVCSQLRMNGMFWTRPYRETVPKEVSFRQMAKARVEVGWKPKDGQPSRDQRQQAQVILGKMAEGEWERTKKARSVSAHDYARRCKMNADKALAEHGELGDDIMAYFETISEAGHELLEILGDDV